MSGKVNDLDNPNDFREGVAMLCVNRWIWGMLFCIAVSGLDGTAFQAGAAEPKAEPGKPAVATSEPKQAGEGKGKPAEPYVEGNALVPSAGGCCDRPNMRPVCRCKPTKKKKPKTEYEVKCELVCVPGCRRLSCGTPQASCCGESCCDSPCGNATVRTKKTLLKKVVDKEEDAWEYEVEWVCVDCSGGCTSKDCGHRGGLLAKPARAWHAVREFCVALFHRH